jgi:L-amino acid N-acyltransferase YncA
MNIIIRTMTPDDYPAVAKIYEEGIATGNATFQTTPTDWASWDNSHLALGRLIAQNIENPDKLGTEGDILGWVSLVAVSSRCVYAGVVESSVYISESARGLGIGLLLMQRLIELTEAQGIWSLRAGVFPENIGSIKLHEKTGFRLVGFHEKVGQMSDGRWRDTLLFERRSQVVGL